VSASARNVGFGAAHLDDLIRRVHRRLPPLAGRFCRRALQQAIAWSGDALEGGVSVCGGGGEGGREQGESDNPDGDGDGPHRAKARDA